MDQCHLWLLTIIHAIAICISIQRISSVGNLVSVTTRHYRSLQLSMSHLVFLFD
jgi:hypothetical protein